MLIAQAGVAYDKAVLKLRGVEWAKKYGLNNEVRASPFPENKI
jgi:hypothetical protein